MYEAAILYVRCIIVGAPSRFYLSVIEGSDYPIAEVGSLLVHQRRTL